MIINISQQFTLLTMTTGVANPLESFLVNALRRLCVHFDSAAQVGQTHRNPNSNTTRGSHHMCTVVACLDKKMLVVCGILCTTREKQLLRVSCCQA